MAKSMPPPGTADIYPDESPAWQRLEESARRVFRLYGYGEIRTPVFEHTEVFQRGIGDETEVVQKEMYTFEDRGGRSLTLRPEGTAGVMRALSGTDVQNGNEQRVYYSGPMFRGERPAAGRRRQFHQAGAENVGRVSPLLDAECILMLMHYLEDLGITGSELRINTRGTAEDRKVAAVTLRDHFDSRIDGMCEDCRTRVTRNVWRILDCKQEACRAMVAEAPDFVSTFSEESRRYFDVVCGTLADHGVNFRVDPQLVRGLDYYAHTVFEVVHSALGAQNAISGGGRYEISLPETKKPLLGVGFAVGLERLLMVQEALGIPVTAPVRIPVFLVGLGDEAIRSNQILASRLRKSGIPVVAECESRSMKSQMRSADRTGAAWVLIRGENELSSGMIVCKNMVSGEQMTVELEKAIELVRDKIG